MQYPIHHISKELIQLMPVAAFDGEVIVVDKAEQVSAAVAYLRTQKVIGVDTEARPSFQRGIHYPTALVQIAQPDFKLFTFYCQINNYTVLL